MTTPWGKAGAWADDSERAELEETTVYTTPAARIGTESDNFPSLAVAAAAKPKKKKNVPMSLAEFSTGTPTGPGTRRGGGGDLGFESKRLTQDEMRMLPTGPKERSAEEMESGRLGGGFRSYGGGGGRSQGGPPGRDGGRDGAWGGGGGGGRRYGGFDDENRSAPPPREDLPSRADEVDNWATTKKSLPSRMDSGGGRDRDRYGGGLGDSGRQDRYSALGGGSRADEVDNWASGKKALPARTNSSSSSFGSGFRDPAATEGDRWTRTGPLPSRDREVEPSRERTRLVFAPPSGGGDGNSNDVAKTTRANPFGAARPREEILAEKGLDYKQLDSDIDTKKTSRPTSSHSSRPTSAHSNRPESPASQVLEVAAKSRPRVNPFGDAKPREVLLQEKGKDWRKIDFELEHRGVNRPETEEEQRLKDEIERLKIELGKEAAVEANGEQSGLQEIILSKEKELEKLISDLDDKVRFGQKATGFSERPGSGGGRSTGFPERPGSGGGRSTGFPERPGSGGGRNAGYPDRPPSQSGPDVEYIDRPRSRGTGDAWRGPVDDRRGGGYQGGRDGGYQGGRDGGYQGGRDGRYQGGRDGRYQGGRDGGYQGGRDGGYQGGRDGGFSSGREDRQRW